MSFDKELSITDEQKKNLTFKYGLPTSIAMIIAAFVTLLSKSEENTIVNYIPIILLFTGIFISAIMYRKLNSGKADVGELFGNGFKMTALITIIMVLWTAVAFKIFPDAKERAIQAGMRSMVEQKYTEKELTDGVQIMRDNFTIYNIFGVLFTYIIAGALCSFMAAIFVRRK